MGIFIIILILSALILFYYLTVNKIKGVSSAGHDEESDRIYREVEKRKLRAKQLGIPKFMPDLYYYISNYPRWIKDSNNRSLVCPLVTEAVDLSEKGTVTGSDDVELIKIRLKGKEYLFSLKQEFYEGEKGELLELFHNDKKVLSLQMFSKRRERRIIAFIEGEWIEDFRQLKMNIENEEKEKINKDMASGEKGISALNKLKQNFGIE